MDFKEAVAKVRNALLIEDYIQKHGVDLKEQSPGKYVGLCPFHSEKTPSFKVDSNFQSYRCFGCGRGGDIFTYVEESENMNFKEALNLLGSEASIDVKELLNNTDQETIDYSGVKEVTRAATDFFVKSFRELPEDHIAKRQILDRGLPLEGKGAMLYGYAPNGGNKLYRYLSQERGYSDDLIKQSGVCSSKGDSVFDMWKGRLMFIIFDRYRNPIGFSGRKLFEEDHFPGKYVNSTATPLFNKSKALYNIDGAAKKAGKENEVFVVEGQFDVAAMVAVGAKNTVASSGTAFTKEQGQMCHRLVGGDKGKVTFVFDGDSAGFDAAVKVFKNVPEIHGSAYAVEMPEGEDPCDFRQEQGGDALREHLLSNRKTLFNFVIDGLAKKHPMGDALGRNQYLQEVSEVIGATTIPSIRKDAIRKVAFKLGLSFEEVEKVVSEKSGRTHTRTTRNESVAYDPEARLEEYSGSEKTPNEETQEDRNLALQESVIEKMRTDRYYKTAAKAIAVFASTPRTRSLIDEELLRATPKQLRHLLKEVYHMEKHVIVEDFRDTKIASVLFSPEFVTNTDHLSEDSLDAYLEKLKIMLKSERERYIRLKENRNSYRTLDTTENKEIALEILKESENND